MPLRRADILRLPWRVFIADARGEARSCRLILSRDGLRKYACALSRHDARRAMNHLRLAIALPWTIITAIYIAATFTIIRLTAAQPQQTVGDLVISILPFAIIGAVYMTIGFAPITIAYRRAHAAYFIAARRCPWCLYDLSGVPTDDNSLTTCPECGGVWQLPANTPPTSPASSAPPPPPTRAG